SRLQKPLENRLDVAWHPHRELLEERPRKLQRHARDLRESIGEIVRLAQAQRRRFLETLWPEGGQVDSGAQGEQALIGADIARRLLPPNVLFARLQGQHPAASAVAIDRLADQSPWDLADELLPARHDAEIRAAVHHRVP